MLLYINCCVRNDSRTDRLARYLIGKLGDSFTEIKAQGGNILPLSQASLLKRTELISNGDYSNEMFDLAKQFASADTIVIGAPYWDLSFPAGLKTYIENIFVSGITFRYTQDGIPEGLCRATRLYYVTTAGGPYIPDFSYDYIKSAAENMLGIKETFLIKADMLDIIGNDAEAIIKSAEDEIDNLI